MDTPRMLGIVAREPVQRLSETDLERIDTLLRLRLAEHRLEIIELQNRLFWARRGTGSSRR